MLKIFYVDDLQNSYNLGSKKPGWLIGYYKERVMVININQLLSFVTKRKKHGFAFNQRNKA